MDDDKEMELITKQLASCCLNKEPFRDTFSRHQEFSELSQEQQQNLLYSLLMANKVNKNEPNDSEEANAGGLAGEARLTEKVHFMRTFMMILLSSMALGTVDEGKIDFEADPD